MKKKINIYDAVGDSTGYVQLVQYMGTDKTIVNSARVSFGVEKDTVNEKDKKLIKYLIDHKHTSTLEHNIATFKFCVPVFVRSQHHRHRTWSYNEISRRYTDKGMQFYCPDHFRTQHRSNRQASNSEVTINPEIYGASTSEFIESHSQASLEAYNDLISNGICREQARMVLPQNLYTEYYGTVNLNNLLKFIDLRMHEGAQWEIQQVAKACLTIAEDIWPTPVGNFIQKRLPPKTPLELAWQVRSTGT